MDTGMGKMEPISNELYEKLRGLDEEDQIPVFAVGEKLDIRGGTYEVKKIKERELVLKPVGRSTKELHGEKEPEKVGFATWLDQNFDKCGIDPLTKNRMYKRKDSIVKPNTAFYTLDELEQKWENEQ